MDRDRDVFNLRRVTPKALKDPARHKSCIPELNHLEVMEDGEGRRARKISFTGELNDTPGKGRDRRSWMEEQEKRVRLGTSLTAPHLSSLQDPDDSTSCTGSSVFEDASSSTTGRNRRDSLTSQRTTDSLKSFRVECPGVREHNGLCDINPEAIFQQQQKNHKFKHFSCDDLAGDDGAEHRRALSLPADSDSFYYIPVFHPTDSEFDEEEEIKENLALHETMSVPDGIVVSQFECRIVGGGTIEGVIPAGRRISPFFRTGTVNVSKSKAFQRNQHGPMGRDGPRHSAVSAADIEKFNKKRAATKSSSKVWQNFVKRKSSHFLNALKEMKWDSSHQKSCPIGSHPPLPSSQKKEKSPQSTMESLKGRFQHRKAPIVQAFADPNKSLPDELSTRIMATVSDVNSTQSLDLPSNDSDSSSSRSSIQLEHPRWSRYCLFEADEYSSWSGKFRPDRFSDRERRKQDLIYELIQQEKHHCANLVFLHMAYRSRLLEEGVLKEEEVDRLIPGVLDTMLQFHLKLYERFKKRQAEADVVSTISDIIAEELEDGELTAAGVSAYTTFGLGKEPAESYYAMLSLKNVKFSAFLKSTAEDERYKNRDLKTMLTVVIGRPTKYPLMLDQIYKYECSEHLKMTERAKEATKAFAEKIDQGLLIGQMSRTWDEISRMLDSSSATTVAGESTDAPKFTMADLRTDHPKTNPRRILCVGLVVVKQTSTPKDEKPEANVLCVLFDDCVVLLQRRGNKYGFFESTASVIAVHALMVRDCPWSMFLVTGAKEQVPSIHMLTFNTKTDRMKWFAAFERARDNNPPTTVRRAPRADAERKAQEEEKKFKDAIEAWTTRLIEHFEKSKLNEEKIPQYIMERMLWYDDLRKLLSELPNRHGRKDVIDQVKAAVKSRFRELKLQRQTGVYKMLEKCTSAREADVFNWIDDRADLEQDDESSDGSSSSSGRNLPRRNKTFHGTTSRDPQLQGSFRRHTTVPKLHLLKEKSEDEAGPSNETSKEDSEFLQEVESMVHQLPLGMPSRARQAATRLIEQIVEMRKVNQQLSNEVAMDRIRIAALQNGEDLSGGKKVTAAMEKLRRKQHEMQEEEARRRKEDADRARKLDERETHIREEEERLKAREALLEARWKTYEESIGISQWSMNASVSSPPAHPPRGSSFRNGPQELRTPPMGNEKLKQLAEPMGMKKKKK